MAMLGGDASYAAESTPRRIKPTQESRNGQKDEVLMTYLSTCIQPCLKYDPGAFQLRVSKCSFSFFFPSFLPSLPRFLPSSLPPFFF